MKEYQERYQKLKKGVAPNSSSRFLRLQAAYFQRFDNLLDKQLNEPYWLKNDEIAEIVANSLHYNDGKEYNLWSFTIMSNHVHSLLTLKEKSLPLYTLLQYHKRFTARQCNKALKREGAFWERETYDHLVRKDDEFENIVRYILNNPVKAGFVNHWSEWKWNYLNPLLS